MVLGPKAAIIAAIVTGTLVSLCNGQNGLSVEFAEVDFQAVEGERKIDFQLNVMGTNTEPIVLTITPSTFNDFNARATMPIPGNISSRAAGDDRAQNEDFLPSPARVIIPPGTSRRSFDGSINITDDNINEPTQVFLLQVQEDLESSSNPEAMGVSIPNQGLSIARIVDDDVVEFSFERPLYSVNESSGFLPDTIQIVRNIPSELEYQFNISLRRGDNAADPGLDFQIAPEQVIIFPANVQRVPLPFNVLPDDLVEGTEDFRLALFTQADNPSPNIRPGQVCNTQILITDDDVAEVCIDREQPIVLREDSGQVEICTQTDISRLPDPAVIAFMLIVIPGTAQTPDDFTTMIPGQSFLTPIGVQGNCFTITVVNDTNDGEGNETFQLIFQFDDTLLNVPAEGCIINVTILDRPVNECEEGLDNCDPIAECVDLPNGFDCICPPGFTGNGTVCDDIDECLLGLDNCSSNAICINTIGSYTCQCLPGFTGDGFTCDDIDECELGLDNCAPNATCNNTIGSFVCVCPPGFTGNGTFCEDIDECLEDTDNCDDNARCINTPGSFQCVCLEGFIGNGLNCTPIPDPEVTPADPPSSSPPPSPTYPPSEPPTVCDPVYVNPIVVMVKPRDEEEDSTTRSTTGTSRSTTTGSSTTTGTSTTGTSTTNTDGTTQGLGDNLGGLNGNLGDFISNLRSRRSHKSRSSRYSTSSSSSSNGVVTMTEDELPTLPQDDPCIITCDPGIVMVTPPDDEEESTSRTTHDTTRTKSTTGTGTSTTTNEETGTTQGLGDNLGSLNLGNLRYFISNLRSRRSHKSRSSRYSTSSSSSSNGVVIMTEDEIATLPQDDPCIIRRKSRAKTPRPDDDDEPEVILNDQSTFTTTTSTRGTPGRNTPKPDDSILTQSPILSSGSGAGDQTRRLLKGLTLGN